MEMSKYQIEKLAQATFDLMEQLFRQDGMTEKYERWLKERENEKNN